MMVTADGKIWGVRSNGCDAPVVWRAGECWCMKCGDALVTHGSMASGGRCFHVIFSSDEYSEMLEIMRP